jgi:hypothetical protein
MNSNEIGLRNVNFFKNALFTQPSSPHNIPANSQDCRMKMKKDHSKRMPLIIKNILLNITQTKVYKDKKLICTKSGSLSLFFYILTLISGLIYLVSNIWFSVANGLAKETKTTILSESANIILILIWFSLGTYPIKIINYIYRTKNLEESIRLKTKSYFKIPSTLILIVLAGGFLYAFIEFIETKKKLSEQISLPKSIVNLIYYFNFIFTIIAVIWNFILALTILFIVRTYTINLRRFLFYLEQDSLNISKISYYFATQENKITCEPPLETITKTNNNNFHINNNDNEDNDDYDDEDLIVKIADYNSNELKNQSELQILDSFKLDINLNDKYFSENKSIKLSDVRHCQACETRFSKLGLKEIKMFHCEHIQSPNSIFYVYWNFSNNFRIFSRLIQRWMFSIVSLILIWCLSCLIKWINTKEPTLTSVIEFGAPLLVLAVICGSYAEANAEANRIIPTIYPLEERILMLNYIKTCPLQLNIYGFVVNYSAEVKFIGAFAVGFLSQIIFHEFND